MTKTKLDKSGYNHLSQHHKNYAFELIGIEQKLIAVYLFREFIVIVSPATRREYVLIGSTATSMSPTVTGAPMPILTTRFAIYT